MKEEYQAPVLEELESTLNCQFVAGDSPLFEGVGDGEPDPGSGISPND